jgi:hypothetical protein
MGIWWHRSRYLLLLGAWVAFVGAAVYLHAQRSSQPPIYDAATYVQKAHNFWKAVAGGKAFDAFAIEPSFRPPGTIAMSYPLGFDPDVRGMYFRSVFFPILFLSVAVVVAVYRRDLPDATKAHIAVLAAFFATLPAFYWFEVSHDFAAPSHWGLVDNFFAGVAALATAAMLRAYQRSSTGWLVACALLASFSLFVKPAGFLVMGAVGAIWLALSLIRIRAVGADVQSRRDARQLLARGAAVFGVAYIAGALAAVSSAYMSYKNLAFGNAAIVIMRNEQPLSWPIVVDMTHMTIGFPFVVWLVLATVLVGWYARHQPARDNAWPRATALALGCASLLMFLFGVWFWLFGSGGVLHARYAIPFVAMAAILATPAVLGALQRMPRRGAAALSVAMLLPVLNITLLLAQPAPSIAWQKWSGVNLSSGHDDPGVTQARVFIDAVARDKRDTILYAMPMGTSDAIFQAAVGHALLATPGLPKVSIVVPGDNQRPTTYRIAELVGADYWLFEPITGGQADRILSTQKIDDINQERILFQAWASRLTANDGVEVVSDSSKLRLLRIKDAQRLESALDVLLADHEWRSVFTQANPKRRLTDRDVEDALAVEAPSLANIRFGDAIALRALSVKRKDGRTVVNLWWRPLPGLEGRDWVLFVHSVDAAGNMVQADYMPLTLTHDGARVRFDTMTFNSAPKDSTAYLAIGFVRPGVTPLVADSGTREWGGMRVIVPNQ